MSSAADLTGLPSRFRVIRILGRGGMGVVYEVEDQHLGLPVALKTFSNVRPEHLLNLKSEFRALAGLSHPNLVNLYELFGHDGLWFFTMELVNGAPFEMWVRQFSERPRATASGPDDPTVAYLDPGEAPETGVSPQRNGAGLNEHGYNRLRMATRQLAGALSWLHGQGIVHRDIKDSNVLVTPEGRLVILDFGLAALLGARLGIRTGGTPAYMAPERFHPTQPAPAEDWYSVGVMIYETMTGRKPRQSLLQKAIVPVISQVQDAPEDLGHLAGMLLEYDPAQRPGSAIIFGLLNGGETEIHPEPLVSRPSPKSLFAREAELGGLHSLAADNRPGRVRVAVVHGASGMGKSVLIDQFAADLGPHWTILRSRCFEQESVPYKAFDGIVDAISELLSLLPEVDVAGVLPRDARALAILFPVLLHIPAIAQSPERTVDRSHAAETRRRATAAFRELLERLSDRRKVMLCIDDFQWADEDSRGLLREVLQPPEPPSLLLLLGCREEQQAHAAVIDGLRRLAGRGEELDVVDLELAPLSRERAAALARTQFAESGETADEERVQMVARDCEGSPYLLSELVAGAALTGRAIELSTALDSVLLSKVEALTPASRRILELVAVSVRPETTRNICSAAGTAAIDPAIVAPLLSSRLVSGLSTDPAGQITIWHDRVRHAVLAHMDDGAKASAHLALARTLDAAGEQDPEVLAVHWDAGGELEPALQCYLQAAARASAALAFEQTVRYYRRAYSICGQTPNAPTDEARVHLAEALANVGRPLESAELFAEAAAKSSGAALLDLRRKAAQQFCSGGYMERGRQETLGVLQDAGMAVQRSERWALLSLAWSHLTLTVRGWRFRPRTAPEIEPKMLRDIDITWSAAIGLYMVDMVYGAELLARSLKLSLRAGEPSRVVRALAWYCSAVSLGGPRFERQVERMLEVAGRLADECGDPYSAGMVRLGRGSARYNLGYFADCAADLEQAHSIFLENCAGARAEAAIAGTLLAWALGTQGRFSVAWPLTERLYREACERGNRLDAANLALAPLYAGLLMRDRTAEALTVIRETRLEWSKHASTLQIVMTDFAEAVMMRYTGNHQESRQLAARARSQAQKAGLLGSPWLRGMFFRMEALDALTAHVQTPAAKHRRVILRNVKLLDAERRDWARCFSALLHAGLASVDGNNEACLKWLQVSEDNAAKTGLETQGDLAKYRRGQLIGGDEGLRVRKEAEASLRHELAGNIDRLLDLFIPMRFD